MNVQEKCVLIDNAMAESRKWQDKVTEIARYIGRNLSPRDKTRADIMDIINNKKRTRTEQQEDYERFILKLYAARNYTIRIREEAMCRPNMEAHLRAASLWPPPMTEQGDIE